jgi:uncharacterized membrane protein
MKRRGFLNEEVTNTVLLHTFTSRCACNHSLVSGYSHATHKLLILFQNHIPMCLLITGGTVQAEINIIILSHVYYENKNKIIFTISVIMVGSKLGMYRTRTTRFVARTLTPRF